MDNTVEAFDLGLAQGADGVESDVRRTRDGRLVFFHDDFILVDGRRVRPESLSLSEIRAVDLGSGRRVPEVRETLLRYKARLSASGAPFLFSLDVLPPPVAVQLARVLLEIDMTDQVVITPSDVDAGYRRAVERIRGLDADVRLVRTSAYSPLGRVVRLIPGRGGALRWEELSRLGFEGINVRARYANVRRIDEIRRHGMEAYVWDCHDERTMRRIAGLAVNAMYTNYPDVLVRVLGDIAGARSSEGER